MVNRHTPRKIEYSHLVPETFWIDLAIHNSLDTEVNLSDLSVTVQEFPLTGSPSATSAVEVETIDDIILGAKETRTVGFCIVTVGILAQCFADPNFYKMLACWNLGHYSCHLQLPFPSSVDGNSGYTWA